jgi:hypothetical protein
MASVSGNGTGTKVVRMIGDGAVMLVFSGL